jgi:lysozyme family protein
MANFNLTYTKYVAPFEGGYANDPRDKGGETYKGIARNYNRNWEGWPIIDRYKAQMGGKIPTNYKFQDSNLDSLVIKRYKQNYWDKFLGDRIKSQDVANIFFDMYVNSGAAVRLMQEVMRSLGKNIVVDGAMGEQTLTALNSLPPADVYNRYKEARRQYYYDIVESDPSQEKFLKGWLNRVNSFPDLKKK